MVDARPARCSRRVPIGAGVDANAFDPGTGLAFASSSDGTLTVATAGRGREADRRPDPGHAGALEDDDARPEDAPDLRRGGRVRGAATAARTASRSARRWSRARSRSSSTRRPARPATECRRHADEAARCRLGGGALRLRIRFRGCTGSAPHLPAGTRRRDREQPRPGCCAARPRRPRGGAAGRRPAPEPRPRLRVDEGHAAPDALARRAVRAVEPVRVASTSRARS